MRYTSKKGTVINIPDGLSARQIKDIKADADAGYGTRAQETANRLGKQAVNRKQDPVADTPAAPPVVSDPTPQPGQPAPSTPLPDVTTPVSEDTVKKNGTIDPVQAGEDVAKAEAADVETNFKLDHPTKITDQNGNVRIITRDPVTGEVTVTDELGGTAKKFRDLAEAAASTFNGDVSRQAAYDATYNQQTKNYDRDQSRELEAQKQEFAERGIPYNPEAAQDPNSKDLYGRTIGGIGQKYQGYRADAADRATIAGNQAYATDAAARDSFLKAVESGAATFGGTWGPYQNNTTTDNSQITADIIALSSDAFLKKYGIDKAAATAKYGVDHQKTGGGGGGNDSGEGGFELIV